LKRLCAYLIGLAVVAGSLGALAPAALATRSSSSGQVPCWKRLLNDWYDGTINNVYPIPCYQQAIKHLPPEISIYGSAKEDIQRAEQAAINHQSAPPEGGSGNGTTTIGGGSGSGNQTPPSMQTQTVTTTQVTNGLTTTTTAVVIVPTSTSSPKNKKHGISGALADITPGDPQAFPLPLLILGAVAIVLVIAGAAGMLWQRSHPHDEPPPA
jgi:hypothetical protein